MEEGSIRIDWNRGEVVQQDLITEEVVEINNTDDDEEEEYLVGEEIIPSNDVTNSLDHIAAENLIYMAHDGHMQSMGDLIEEQVEQVENANYNEELYYECQVTEEVITDDWVQPEGEERVEIPADQLCANSDIPIEEDMDVPLPTDQDEYTTSRPYPCDFCSRRFRKKASLMNHMVAHQNDRPHVCNLCGARYIRRCDLLNHLKIHAYIPEDGDLDELEETHNFQKESIKSKRRYETINSKRKNVSGLKSSNKKQKLEAAVDIVKYDYDDDDDDDVISDNQNSSFEIQDVYERFPVVDPKKPFVCQHCGVGFARQKALASHARVHGGDSPFECETCGEMFWDPTTLKDHQRIHHQGQGAESEYEPENDSDDSDFQEEVHSKYGEFYCDICGMSFHRFELLKRHSRQHIKIDSSIDDNNVHCCNVCGENFQEALDLLAHAEVHARFQPLKCMLCGESFVEELAIKEHLNIVHSNELTQHSCRLCGKMCRDGRTLMKHSWDHSREKNHSCSKCGKNFHNKARLKRHMVSHRNKSVSCDVCGDEFPDGRSLMNHRHSHSNVTGRQFPCRECGKTFGSRSSQQIHIRIHTGERPYGCRYCWKAFADGGTLRKHERIHTGEKPYVCSVCPRAFNQRVVLREHIRSHHSSPDTKRGNSETPYYCQVCHDLFASSVELIQHLIQHSDLNTAMKRQPMTGPRKYKRRRKLKPHELERLRAQKSKSGDIYYTDEDEPEYAQEEEDDDVDYQEDLNYSKSSRARNTINQNPRSIRPTSTVPFVEKKQSISKKKSNLEFDLLIKSLATPLDQLQSNSVNNNIKTNKSITKKKKIDSGNQPARPKMIHTQKTRVAIEDGKRKTKTLITRTTSSTNENSKQNERNRPRTKNVNYHILMPDKLPNATFPTDVGLTELLNIKQEQSFISKYEKSTSESDGGHYSFDLPRDSLVSKYNSDIVNDLEEILRSPIKGNQTSSNELILGISENENLQNSSYSISTRPKRNVRQKFSFKIASPPSPSRSDRKTNIKYLNNNNNKSSKSNNSIKTIIKEEIDYESVPIKQEAEEKVNVQIFRCEMCSAVFSDRAQLLVHVPIHI